METINTNKRKQYKKTSENIPPPKEKKNKQKQKKEKKKEKNQQKQTKYKKMINRIECKA